MRLTQRTPAALAALVALAATFAAPASAFATMTYTYNEYDAVWDRGTPSSAATYFTTYPISLAECEQNDPIEIVISNVPYTSSTNLVWDLWYTNGTSVDCKTATERTGTSAQCYQVTDALGDVTSTTMTLELEPQTLFGDCGSSTSSTFFLFAVTSTSPSGAIDAGYTLSFTMTLDVDAPDAPTVSDSAGDRSIEVTWENNETSTLSQAYVYFDDSVDCDSIDSSVLVEGSAPPSSLEPVAVVTGSSPTTATLDGADLGLVIDGDNSGAIAVTVFDPAHNESVLSNVACIERVEVTGFWEAYCEEHGLDAEQCSARYSGCAAHPSRSGSRGALVLVALALLGTVLRRRSRGRS